MPDRRPLICPSGGRIAIRAWGAWLLGVCLLAVPGCGGCTSEPSPDTAETGQAAAEKPGDKSAADKLKEKGKGKDKPKPKADFDPLRFTIMPGDPAEPLRTLKPGHWTAAALQARANNFDFQGELIERGSTRSGLPLLVEGTPFYLAWDRPVVLPKGQQKQLEITLFAPRTLTRPWFQSQLRDSASRLDMRREQEQVQPMPVYQYELVVLAAQPDRYRFLKLLEAVRPITLAETIPPETDGNFYHIVAVPLGNHARLPSQSLLWTSIAAIVWDGVLPPTLDKEQQLALIDWLHWGGNLIISGPKSLDALRGSFLDAYLPVTPGGSRELTARDLSDIADAYHVQSVRPQRDRLHIAKAWPAIDWTLREGATELATTGGLIAERAVGRGRLAVTAFSLTQPELVGWRGFDGLFNACLLRRGPRCFTAGEQGLRRTTWVGQARPEKPEDQVRISNQSLNWLYRDVDEQFWNPQRVTGVRYFARDAGTPESAPPRVLPEIDDPPEIDANMLPYEGGAAAWNDWGAVSEAVRRSLRAGAGIKVPRPSFVLWILALYLTVLVPVNWGIFRLLGRVEWAWAVTPVVSLSFAALVIWLAQLDIGFVRSATELRILELHAGYPRAHLSRYTALYASLSTAFDLRYEAPSALAQPFPATRDFTLLRGQSRREVQVRREEGLVLSGVDVASNSTVMVHGEEMWDAGGSLLWVKPPAGPPELTNGTRLPLAGVRLLRRAPADEGSNSWESAWIGELAAGAVVQPRFERVPDELSLLEGRLTNTPGGDQSLELSKLIETAEDGASLAAGEVRLVGWCTDEVPGLEIRPATTRRRQATLVVARLAPQRRPQPSPDVWQMAAGQTDETRRSDDLAPAAPDPAAPDKPD